MPTTSGSPAWHETPTAMPLACGAKLMHLASVLTAMPSASRISRTAVDTSASSRPTRRGPISTTVTWAPNRRYIWANSSPI